MTKLGRQFSCLTHLGGLEGILSKVGNSDFFFGGGKGSSTSSPNANSKCTTIKTLIISVVTALIIELTSTMLVSYYDFYLTLL